MASSCRARSGVLAAALLATAPLAFGQEEASGEEGPVQELRGLAVAQAPEAGLGICLNESQEAASRCAQRQCMEESGLGPDDCAVNLWCFPHYWAADVFVQHREGPHWHEQLCGATDRAELEALIAVKCSRPDLMECAPTAIWDLDGNELLRISEN